mmetsp:Transcript_18894/g.30356  ORF Transcript_18894/g.30356 Transcript_18894/m.30356 type:complete len:207 (-) Transcript_18894:489-1109(-)
MVQVNPHVISVVFVGVFIQGERISIIRPDLVSKILQGLHSDARHGLEVTIHATSHELATKNTIIPVEKIRRLAALHRHTLDAIRSTDLLVSVDTVRSAISTVRDITIAVPKRTEAKNVANLVLHDIIEHALAPFLRFAYIHGDETNTREVVSILLRECTNFGRGNGGACRFDELYEDLKALDFGSCRDCIVNVAVVLQVCGLGKGN